MMARDKAPEHARRIVGLGPEDEPPPGTILSDVEAETVLWLWERRIPLGKITVVDGDPGNGKSALTTDLAARLSVGRPFPDGQPTEPAGVVIMNAENGLADTIRPRVDAAGGDPTKVLSLAAIEFGEPDERGDRDERTLSIPEDIRIIENALNRMDAKMLVVDPLMAFLSEGVNAHKDQDVRRALAPLKRMAERTGCAVVLVRHLNKASGGNSLYRGGGSIGIIGAARSGLLVGQDPEDDKIRVLAGQKSNLTEMPESLKYRIVTAANGAARVEHLGTTTTTANAMLSAPTDAEERSALGEAMKFLREELGKAPVMAKNKKARAKEMEISDATLRRAKQALAIVSSREGDDGWSWSLPKPKKGTGDA